MLPKTLEEICDLFDCQVIEDQYEDRQGNWKRCFILGDRGDMSVGIRPVELTPYFDTEAELRAYVESDEGRAAINAKAAETFLDDWDAEEQDWRESLIDLERENYNRERIAYEMSCTDDVQF